MIQYILKSREDIVNNVCKYTDNINIYIPVHFNRIMNNIQHQLGITKNYLIDITALEVYELLDHYYKILDKNELWKPSHLFKVAWYYYLSPKNLLVFKRFNKKAVETLIESIVMYYKKSII